MTHVLSRLALAALTLIVGGLGAILLAMIWYGVAEWVWPETGQDDGASGDWRG